MGSEMCIRDSYNTTQHKGPVYIPKVKTVGPKIILCHNYVILCHSFCKSALVGAVLRDVKIFTLLCGYVYRSLVLYCKTSLTKCALVTRNAWDNINRFTTLRVRRRAAH